MEMKVSDHLMLSAGDEFPSFLLHTVLVLGSGAELDANGEH